ncbi:shikimate kinase [Nonomuraea sp. NBC_01738]|uniref:shikimate kinase n=1 Tax=Nonomuraea sp. NBC_01738 TaxID=2976003 RepID=UPI002E0E8672|nr:shikimate kinase [Nonomuraea sp. NBC_01738]
MSRNKHVVIIGLMGSGKTTVGSLVAASLGRPMTDSDGYLSEHYGLTAAQIAVADGPAVLHAREAEHLLTALHGPPSVIAAASSTVQNPQVRTALRQAFVVWLDTSDAVLTQRMRSADHRPPFPPAVMRARREPYFREVADLRLDVTSATPQESATTICEAL